MSIIRLLITTEGQAEQKFVRAVLTPHLYQFQIYADARPVLTSKDKKAHKEFRGGLKDYQKPKQDILTWMKEDNNLECRFTTMFDLYALPNDFPGYANAQRKRDPYERVKVLENEMKKDINDRRFIPYIQVHEFEALILADPKQLGWEYLEHERPINNLITMVGTQNPELINDNPETAPSKRIIREIPEYDKVTAGVSVAEKIGINNMRNKCRHFNEWLQKLEKLGNNS